MPVNKIGDKDSPITHISFSTEHFFPAIELGAIEEHFYAYEDTVFTIYTGAMDVRLARSFVPSGTYWVYQVRVDSPTGRGSYLSQPIGMFTSRIEAIQHAIKRCRKQEFIAISQYHRDLKSQEDT